MEQDSIYKQFRCVVRSEIEPKDKNVLWWNINDSALYSFYNGVWIKNNNIEFKNLDNKIQILQNDTLNLNNKIEEINQNLDDKGINNSNFIGIFYLELDNAVNTDKTEAKNIFLKFSNALKRKENFILNILDKVHNIYIHNVCIQPFKINNTITTLKFYANFKENDKIHYITYVINLFDYNRSETIVPIVQDNTTT